MHIRRRAADLAQARRLEGMVRRREAQHHAAAAVIARQADIVEGIVGQREAAMTIRATGLSGKQAEAGDLLLGERLGVAADPAIEAGLRRHQRPLIGGQGAGDIQYRDLRLARKRGREFALKFGVAGKARHQSIQRLRHLIGVGDWPGCLLFEAARAAVPETLRTPGKIPQARGVTFEGLARDATALRLAVGEAFVAIVTARTRQRIVDRQPGVVKQRVAKRALLIGIRIVSRKRDGRRAAETGFRHFECRLAARACGQRGGSAAQAAGEKHQREKSRRQRAAHPARCHPYISLPAASSTRAISLSTLA